MTLLRRTGSALRKAASVQAYLRRGRKPWSGGYLEYRNDFIVRVLQDPDTLTRFRLNQSLPEGYGPRLDERVVEYPWVISKLTDAPGRLLDAGSSLNHVFLLDFPILAKKTLVIYTLAPEGTFEREHVSYLYGDLRDTILRDGTFDEVVCISTLEHVGLDNTFLYTTDKRYKESQASGYREALRELRRLLAPGGRLFLTVPYGAYQDFGWLQQFDRRLLDDALDVFDGTLVDRAFYRYTAGGWILATSDDCDACRYYDVHARSDYDADYAAASRAVACVTLTR